MMSETSGLAVRLKELRTIHNLSQDEVASALGVVRQTYSHYESGRRQPKYDVLFKLSELYHISLDDLMELSSEQSSNDISTMFSKSKKNSVRSDNDLSQFLDYFNDPINEKRFKNFSNLEKELCFYFEHIPDSDKRELIEIAKIKYRNRPGSHTA